jgi:hypothetical protein
MAAPLPPLRNWTCRTCKGAGSGRECPRCLGSGREYEVPPTHCPWCDAAAVHRFTPHSARPGPLWMALYQCAAEYGGQAAKGCPRIPADAARVVADMAAERGLDLTEMLLTKDAATLLKPYRARSRATNAS